MNPAPILLFTYKRLNTLKKTVEALLANELAIESDLFIFSDAHKYEDDREIVDNIRKYVNTITGFKTVTIVEAVKNKGLARSIIDGVSSVFETYGRVIVLEDDLGTTPNFLTFMNSCLDKYEDTPEAYSISGYSFDLGNSSNTNDEAYFLNRGWSWGWATWKDRWTRIDWEVKDYQNFINDKIARKAFSKGGSDLNKMLDNQMSGTLDSWAIRWFYHQFRVKGLTLYPIYSKVFNNGFDEFATHTNGSEKRYLPKLDTKYKVTFILPSKVEISTHFQARFNKKMGIMSRIKSKIQTMIKRLMS